MTEPTGVLRVGQIVKPHGIEGEVIVEPYTDFPEERFEPGVELSLFDGDDSFRGVTVEGSRWHQDRILLKLDEIDDRDRAEELRDCWLGVSEEDAFEQEEAFYGHQLLDLSVRDQEGRERGTIKDVHPDRLNPLAEVEVDGDLLDFPLSEDLIIEVNPDEGFIVLKFPEGWEKLKRN